MAIIKHEKPIIFSELRSKSSHDATLHFLTHIDADYESAKKRLSEIKKSIN